MADDEKKGPSKKELKKLAKKAEKEAAKAATKGGGGGAAAANTNKNGSCNGALAVAVAAAAAKANQVYRLANVPADGTTNACTLKSCMASVIYGTPLLPGGAADDLPFVHGPALLYGDVSSACPAVAFGGNGIVKALALANNAGEGKNNVTPMVDDWMEYERSELRPALSSGNAKKIEAAMSKLAEALEEHGGTSVLAGSEPLSAADLVITLTFLHQGNTSVALPSSVQSYVDTTKNSPAYAQAKKLAATLLPPAPFDPSDPSLLRASSAIFADAISSAFPSAVSLGIEIKAFKCKDIRHGDYQCNVAMPLFKKLKDSGALPPGINTPQQVAQSIIDSVGEDNPLLEDLKVNGPGFVMSRVKASYLEGGVNDIVKNGAPTKPKCDATSTSSSGPSNVVVDFSSPNIAKEMHVGHLRSTIIGEAVCRILEYTGSKVHRVNHVGDWGTQFGMLIQYLKEEYPDFHGNVPNITDLTSFYKNAKSRFDERPEFKKVSQLNVVKLQAGDEECREIWQVLCDVSRKEFEKVYNRLDITVEECGESFYNDKIAPVIDEFIERNMCSVEDGGAKCVFVPKFKVPLMLQKSDGGYGYDSTDMAAIKYRLDVLKASQIVYITDFTQADHFEMVFAAARKIGWVDDESGHRLDHIGFGTVQGEDGKRFKTRSGDTVRLVDLLDEAVSRMEASLNERAAEGKANITPDEVHATASAMGYGAVKYFDLRRNPTSSYKFSYDAMLDTKGNTAIYLLYAHARLESIVSKGKADHDVDVDVLIKDGKAKIVLAHKSERNLGLHLQFFADCIEETLKDLFPYHICDFLYALSIAASEFATQCKVLGSPEMESRLLLCRATAITMRRCFDLLGIRHVMRI
eukprot:CAMPEP_0172535672 /NCGR_PEP_ID=MMETSP1067-20121228/7570_1 /TAXON_ID=265564 ORGANISM="Thalassiosira punctigera, Strain Tpunct2005C2" /NCGR_SAMPLE_ID=MMETSP1067 /ASSEMBLY_ACC=CAM_ASM_000444 /LENGTH=861 /DNA_ID=CAMNT_0013320613 /DNA_START=27 /DNA_END=2612 /DNA_ORIENTATION=+